MPRRALRFLLGLCIALPALAGAAELRSLELKHRGAEEMIPVVQPLLEPGASVSGVDFRLFIRSSERNFREIERVVASLDTPRRMLRIDVEQDQSGSSVERRDELSADTRVGGNTRIIVTPRGGAGSGTIVEHDGVRYRTERRTSAGNSRGGQFMTVLDGGSALLRVGTVYTDLEPFVVLAGDRLRLAAGVVLREVATGFEVRPRLQNDHVLLDITPRLAFRDAHGGQDVSFQELTTSVRARLGEWVDLGGTIEHRSRVHAAILGRHAETAGRQHTLRVKVEALDAGRR